MLTNKLDFLEVSRKGVSNLKILLIEMEVNNPSLLKQLKYLFSDCLSSGDGLAANVPEVFLYKYKTCRG